MGDTPKTASAVECPRCGAKPEYDCRSKTGRYARTHKARWNAVGIKRPSSAQIVADIEYKSSFFRKHSREASRKVAANLDRYRMKSGIDAVTNERVRR